MESTSKPRTASESRVGLNALLGVLWPFVSAKKHAADVAAANERIIAAETNASQLRREAEQRHATELDERTKRVDAIIQRFSEMQWSGPDEGDKYALQLCFDPRMIGYGNLDRRELELIAERFARQVQREIVTAKFVESARDHRYSVRR